MITFTTEKLAQCLGLTPRRVKQLKAEGIIHEVRPGTGLYIPSEAVQAYINYIRSGSGKSCDYYEERAALVHAKRKKEELELMQLDGEMHSADDIERVITGMLVKFKSRLMAIPSKAAPVLAEMRDREKIFYRLKSYIDEALNELADYDSLFGEKNHEKSDEKAIEEDI